MSVELDIRNLKNPKDLERKRAEFFKLLRLRAKLNDNYEQAVNTMIENRQLEITPKAPVEKTTGEKLNDSIEQQQIAFKNLCTIMAPDEAKIVLSRLYDGKNLTALNSLNRNWNRIKEGLKGATFIDSTYFITYVNRLAQKEIEAPYGIALESEVVKKRKSGRPKIGTTMTRRLTADERRRIAEKEAEDAVEAEANRIAEGKDDDEEGVFEEDEEKEERYAVDDLKRALLDYYKDKPLQEIPKELKTQSNKLYKRLNAIKATEARLRELWRNRRLPPRRLSLTPSRNLEEEEEFQDAVSAMRSPMPSRSSSSSSSSFSSSSAPIRQAKGLKFKSYGHAKIVKKSHLRRLKTGNGIESLMKEKYKTFGRYVIHIPSLKKSVLNIKYPSWASIASIPQQVIDDELREFIMDLLEHKEMNKRYFQNLKDSNQKLFQKIAFQAQIDDQLGLGLPRTDEEREELKRFELVRGEVIAGQNNPEVIKELKHFIIKFMGEGKLTKKQGYDILSELVVV